MSVANVLLVDDEAEFIETFSERLELRNLEISKAFSGEEALEELGKTHTIEVVILDVKMPGMDGMETLRAIKREFPIVEVIMLTGHGTRETALEGLKAGASDYLVKPADIDELIKKSEEAFDRRLKLEEKIMMAQSVKNTESTEKF